MALTDEQLLRYSRHILLDEWGIEAQERLFQAHALVIGAGGLGSPVALYLASAGVGHVTLVDHDLVDSTNLQRQIAHTADRVGQAKVASAQVAMRAINPTLRVTPLQQRADDTLLAQQVPLADVVIDCTDNFIIRQAINRACVAHRVPLVSGAGIRWDGQLSVYNLGPRSPCYACVFPPESAVDETRCATLGVFAPLVGVVGSLQAAEALKVLGGVGQPLVGQLLLVNGLYGDFQAIQISKDPACPVCGNAPAP